MSESQSESSIWKCDECGIMHEDKDRVKRHILNQHSDAKHDFTERHAVNRYLVEMES